MDTSQIGVLMVAGVVFFMIAGVVLLRCVFLWLAFEKMGEPGYKGIIPLYNTYVLFEKVWEEKYFLLYFAMLFLFAVYPDGQEGGLTGLIRAVLSLGFLFTEYALYIRIARRFGHGIPLAIGLIVFPTIFWGVLALDGNEFKEVKNTDDQQE